MTHIDQIIADALAGSPETHVSILAREVVRLREAPSVVLPDGDGDDDHEELRENTESILAERAAEWAENGFMDGDKAAMESQIKILWRAYSDLRSRARTIPAHRVLGEGMVAVAGSCVWQLDDEESSTWSTTCKNEWQFIAGGPKENDTNYCPHCGGRVEIENEDAIRANQGGDHA